MRKVKLFFGESGESENYYSTGELCLITHEAESEKEKKMERSLWRDYKLSAIGRLKIERPLLISSSNLASIPEFTPRNPASTSSAHFRY